MSKDTVDNLVLGRAQWHGHQETLLWESEFCQSALAMYDETLKIYNFPGNFTSGN